MTDKLPSDERVEILELARQMDWQQVVLNGGPPCFAVDEYVDRFCGRAERWHQDGTHKFVSLADLLSSAVALAKAGMREAAAQVFDKYELMWNGMKSGDAPHAARDARMAAKTIRALPDSAADVALERIKADAVREARRIQELLDIEVFGVMLADAEIECGKKLPGAFKALSERRNERIAELEKP
jgi:hypothetical protein